MHCAVLLREGFLFWRYLPDHFILHGIFLFYPGHPLFQVLSHVLLPVLLSSCLPLWAFRRLGLIQSMPRDPL